MYICATNQLFKTVYESFKTNLYLCFYSYDALCAHAGPDIKGRTVG